MYQHFCTLWLLCVPLVENHNFIRKFAFFNRKWKLWKRKIEWHLRFWPNYWKMKVCYEVYSFELNLLIIQCTMYQHFCTLWLLCVPLVENHIQLTKIWHDTVKHTRIQRHATVEKCSTRRKPLTCRKSLTNSHDVVHLVPIKYSNSQHQWW
jgi:hypothetical protein